MFSLFRKKPRSAAHQNDNERHSRAMTALENMSDEDVKALVKDAMKCLPAVLPVKKAR